jgi:hypothetical protein
LKIGHDKLPGVQLDVDVERAAEAVPPLRVVRVALDLVPRLRALEAEVVRLADELRRWWRRE